MKVCMEVKSCKECPYCVFVPDDMGPYDSWECKKDPKVIIRDENQIAEDCPLNIK